MIARQPVQQAPAPRPLAQTHVEYEHSRGHYVGFVLDGGRVERVVETKRRKDALDEAQARAERLNRKRLRSAP